ncbi:MAG: inositol monophosphatase family protein [Solirubrobacterales bacterium]
MNQLPPDPALDADWTGICRHIVEEQKKLFAEYETIQQRDNYEGVGEGGDHALVLDRMCEDVIFAELEKLADSGGAAFTAISEERGTVLFNEGGNVWVVIDPIDGSLNFKRTIPQHSLSIAVATAPNMGAVEFGYVYDFGTGDEFLAQSGEGAYLNEERINLEPREGLEVVGIEGPTPPHSPRCWLNWPARSTGCAVSARWRSRSLRSPRAVSTRSPSPISPARLTWRRPS